MYHGDAFRNRVGQRERETPSSSLSAVERILAGPSRRSYSLRFPAWQADNRWVSLQWHAQSLNKERAARRRAVLYGAAGGRYYRSSTPESPSGHVSFSRVTAAFDEVDAWKSHRSHAVSVCDLSTTQRVATVTNTESLTAVELQILPPLPPCRK